MNHKLHQITPNKWEVFSIEEDISYGFVVYDNVYKVYRHSGDLYKEEFSSQDIAINNLIEFVNRKINKT